jgi:hypothetical protein
MFNPDSSITPGRPSSLNFCSPSDGSLLNLKPFNTSSPDFAQQYRKQYEEEKDLFLNDKPYLKLKFESPGDLNLRQTKEDSLDDLRRLVNSNDVSLSNSSISKIRNIIDIYDNAKIAMGSLGYSDMDNAFRLKIFERSTSSSSSVLQVVRITHGSSALTRSKLG